MRNYALFPKFQPGTPVRHRFSKRLASFEQRRSSLPHRSKSIEHWLIPIKCPIEALAILNAG
jgi:hypothetical protein